MKTKSRIVLSCGAVVGGILALLLQRNVYFLAEEIKTLIIAFLPWMCAEIFNFTYNKLSGK